MNPKTGFAQNSKMIFHKSCVKNILDFVCWGHNASNKTSDIEIPDYHSTLMSIMAAPRIKICRINA
jgi:hypothetical protein